MTTGDVLIDRFLLWLRAGGRRPATVDMRRRQLRQMCRDGIDPLTCTEADLIGWMACSEWMPATRAANRSALRAFFEWCRDQGERDDDPAARLPRVRVPATIPRPASDTALTRARALAASPHERCMVELAARAGLRRSEIAGLRFADLTVDLDGLPVLHVVGKGGRERLVPIDLALADQLRGLRCDWVFPSHVSGEHVSAGHVGVTLSRLLGPDTSAHDLRRRFASRAYALGGRDVLAVQRLLGHASPTTTQVYIQVPDADLRRAAAAAS